MLHEIKHLIAGIRSHYPQEPIDGVININLLLSDGTMYKVQMDGAPPSDTVTVSRGEEVVLQVKNWGDQVIRDALPVGAFQDTPGQIKKRQDLLKEYDNKRGRPPKK